MRLGRHKSRITILRFDETARNALNEPVGDWPAFGKFWGERQQQRPTESWKAGQTAAQVETAWRLRWTARAGTISTSDRLMCGGTQFEIIGVTGDQRSGWIDIVGIAYSEEGPTP
jgi:head-tail adaptor